MKNDFDSDLVLDELEERDQRIYRRPKMLGLAVIRNLVIAGAFCTAVISAAVIASQDIPLGFIVFGLAVSYGLISYVTYKSLLAISNRENELFDVYYEEELYGGGKGDRE